MNTTPPMTDAELLAYIERTPELKLLQEYFVNDFVRAFHAHEQLVRAEEREACAKLCEEMGAQRGYDRADTFQEAAAAIRASAKQGGK